MANYEDVSNLRDRLLSVSMINVERVAKTRLGSLALDEVPEQLKEITRQSDYIRPFLDRASNRLLQEPTRTYDAYFKILDEIATQDGELFVRNRNDLRERIEAAWDQINDVWPRLAVIAADQSGQLLASKEHAYDLAKAKKAALDDFRSEAQTLVDQAKSEAARIVESSRGTARKFSVQKAQAEFDSAHEPLKKKACFWGMASGAVFTSLLLFCWHTYAHPPQQLLSPDSGRQTLGLALYLLVIRITILTAIAAVLSFCLRVFRAHLHMLELNNHRRRVANSMPAFVESAHYPKQRDYIFSRLVDAVVNFGDSGLLNSEGSDAAPTISTVAIEAITKNLAK